MNRHLTITTDPIDEAKLITYQDRTYRLKEGDTVSLFPPVQGG